MTDKKDNKKKLKNKKISSKKIAGAKFDDLTEEQMEDVQGQGNNKNGKGRGIFDILTSSGEYTCR
ncbi:hypothetical protein ACYSNW_06330 [Enterococcus sp. LJL99]